MAKTSVLPGLISIDCETALDGHVFKTLSRFSLSFIAKRLMNKIFFV